MNRLLDKQMCEDIKNMPIREGTYFITGATGFIGKYAVLSLLYLCKYQNLRAKVIVAVRNYDKAYAIFSEYVEEDYFEIVVNDMLEDYIVQQEIDYVVHAAARKDVTKENSYDVFSDNIIAVNKLLKLANEKRVQKILLISTCSVYGDLLLKGITEEGYLGGNTSLKAGSCYAESKRASEYMFAAGLEQFSLDGSIVRLFSVYGPGMDVASKNVFSDLFRQVLEQDIITIQSSGKGIRNFSYISDVIYGIFTALFHGQNGKAYNIGSRNENYSILELAEKLVAKSHKKSKIVIGKEDDDKVTIQAPSFELIEKIKTQPRTSLDDGLDRMFEYYHI